MKYSFLCLIISVWIHKGATEDEMTNAEAATNTDYCQNQWRCGSSKHLMCEFKKNQKTEKCSKIMTQISDKERQLVLRLVNEFRNSLASGEDPAFLDGAMDIRQVTWDYELEKFAEVYGSQCGSSLVPELDPCAKTAKFQQGTRLLWGFTQTPGSSMTDTSIEDVIMGPQGWTSEVPEGEIINMFEPVEGDDRLEPNYGRFTMLAWAKTYKIGCSIITCTCSPQLPDSKKLVCFFGPGGNIAGHPVFLMGKACQSCPEGTSCNTRSVWKNLCAAKYDPTDFEGLSPATYIHSAHTGDINQLIAALLLAKHQQS